VIGQIAHPRFLFSKQEKRNVLNYVRPNVHFITLLERASYQTTFLSKRKIYLLQVISLWFSKNAAERTKNITGFVFSVVEKRAK